MGRRLRTTPITLRFSICSRWNLARLSNRPRVSSSLVPRFGIPARGATLKYPEICLQSWVGDWWTTIDGGVVTRGRLLWAVVPHLDQHPFALLSKGRTEETEHGRADYEIQPLTRRTFGATPSLPVAGMPDI